RYDFAVPRRHAGARTGYGFPDGTRWYFTVPGRGDDPRIAYTACNGSEDEDVRHLPAGRNARWAHLLGRHRGTPFHLALHGGDQLYADAVWARSPALAAWNARSWRERLDLPFTPEMAAETEDHFIDHYVRLWRQPETAAFLASAPSIMMWNDHDIFDGWGSHPDERRASPVFQGVYTVARHCFSLFQMGMDPMMPVESCWGAATGNFCQGFRLGRIGLLALDLRSERLPRRVLSERTWTDLPGWLDRFSGVEHLILMSSVPLVHVNLNAVERLVNAWPGQARFEDDLRDQWRSYAHETEWLRLLRLLGDFSVRRRARVTVISGEVHLGFAAIVHGPWHDIWQLTSSGIAHPPPNRMYVRILDRLARRREVVRDGLTLEMLPYGETGTRFLRSRNWLELAFDGTGALVADWHAEGETAPLRHWVPSARERPFHSRRGEGS
ncbi:MAG TPA: alkaline phosphatase D family protein, partial [Arenibaculum sp.]|nr:alkaline phosphatase D family protein [Arenibaculum sp.]